MAASNIEPNFTISRSHHKNVPNILQRNPMVYQALKEKHPINHIILSEREHMKEKEDTWAIENRTDYYSFAHKKSDDNTDVNSFLPIPQGDDGLYTCRYCCSKYKKKMIFHNHV
jgi:hypothetical protein